MGNPNSKPKIRQFHEKDITFIEEFDEDFQLVLKECKNIGWIYVAVIKEILVGFIAIIKGQESAYFDDNILNWAEIRELHVRPAFQNKSIGTLLTKFAIELAHSKGFSRMYVSTDDFNNPARRTYEKCGFKEFNKIIRYRYDLQDNKIKK